MHWTYEWLLDYLDTKATAVEVADRLTEIGLEIEGLTAPMIPIAAKVVECESIEGTKLHLLKVDDGTEIRQVVCGAPNCHVGLVGVLARPGCKVGDIEIKVGKIRGHESNGMMCSEKELGVGDNHEGIIELDAKKYKAGQAWGEAKGDIVFEAKALANRPDYLAVRGIARDLSATGIGKYKNKALEIKEISGKRKAIIENKNRCPIYNFAEILGIKIAPSHPLIAARLSAIGVNPKNAPVDATNFVCYDLGQPMHCFDADEIKGDIIIRSAKEGEKFTDLFDIEHVLTKEDLVITDSAGILALAGIVGGKRGMTTDKTKNIILESAYFEPLGIRKTRRRLGLSTDSSYRFERGIDPTITSEALARAIEIIINACGGNVISMTCEQPKTDEVIIKYDPKLFLKKTGVDVPEKTQKEILEKLGYVVDAKWKVTQPAWRIDDAIPEKLISDIIRIYGYDKIPMTNVTTVVPAKKRAPVPTYDGIKTFFAKNRNLIESVSFGFGNLANEVLASARRNVKISNPIVDYMNTARNSLIPNMLDAVAENAKKGYPNLAMFECGTVFDGPNPGEEHKQLVIARTGEAAPRHWLKRGREVDVFDIKSDLVAYFGEAKTEMDNPPMWAHPYRYGRLVRDGKTLGEFGELHPKLARHWKIKIPVMIGLIDDLTGLPRRRDAVPRNDSFQPITRDFSFILEKEIVAEDIVAIAKNADQEITDVREFDFYENSAAFQITIEPSRNLTDTDLLEIQKKVISAVERLGAKIRDK